MCQLNVRSKVCASSMQEAQDLKPGACTNPVIEAEQGVSTSIMPSQRTRFGWQILQVDLMPQVSTADAIDPQRFRTQPYTVHERRGTRQVLQTELVHHTPAIQFVEVSGALARTAHPQSLKMRKPARGPGTQQKLGTDEREYPAMQDRLQTQRPVTTAIMIRRIDCPKERTHRSRACRRCQSIARLHGQGPSMRS